jgi:hypothetical protein
VATRNFVYNVHVAMPHFYCNIKTHEVCNAHPQTLRHTRDGNCYLLWWWGGVGFPRMVREVVLGCSFSWTLEMVHSPICMVDIACMQLLYLL